MTLEQINDIDDKILRMKLLRRFVSGELQEQKDVAEIVADDEMNASRDEALGMMSRYGKPDDGVPEKLAND